MSIEGTPNIEDKEMLRAKAAINVSELLETYYELCEDKESYPDGPNVGPLHEGVDYFQGVIGIQKTQYHPKESEIVKMAEEIVDKNQDLIEKYKEI
jgi:hypothetical protein